MKVCASPVAFAPDYKNYNHEAEQAHETKHMDEIRAWLKSNGKKSYLIHLPYGVNLSIERRAEVRGDSDHHQIDQEWRFQVP